MVIQEKLLRNITSMKAGNTGDPSTVKIDSYFVNSACLPWLHSVARLTAGTSPINWAH